MAEWFEQKRYGIGAGRPIAWQGWLVTAVYLVIVLGERLRSLSSRQSCLE